MENNELDNKIINNVRNRIVVSNLEKEENMKINKVKQLISISAVSLLVLCGGFFTANAATDGKLAEDIKDKIVNIKFDENKYELKHTETQKDKDGNEKLTYILDSKDGKEECIIMEYTDNLDDEDLKLEATIDTDDTEENEEKILLTIKDNKGN